MRIRQAREADAAAVTALTSDMWPDRPEVTDYVPDVFESWVESDGTDQRTFVARVEDEGESEDETRVAGLCQCMRLSDHEAWAHGMRVHPDYRGRMPPALCR